MGNVFKHLLKEWREKLKTFYWGSVENRPDRIGRTYVCTYIRTFNMTWARQGREGKGRAEKRRRTFDQNIISWNDPTNNLAQIRWGLIFGFVFIEKEKEEIVKLNWFRPPQSISYPRGDRYCQIDLTYLPVRPGIKRFFVLALSVLSWH